MGNSLLTVENLTLKDILTSNLILSEISFDLQEKEILGVVGESGSGKTVLSQAIVSWLPDNLKISSGSINFLGKDINKISETDFERDFRGRQIAYIGPNAINSLDPTYPVGYQLLEKAISVDNKNTSKKFLKKKLLNFLMML